MRFYVYDFISSIHPISDPCLHAQCHHGYECIEKEESLVKYECRDVDECESNVCATNQQCINVPGGFKCQPINFCETSPCDEGFQCINADIRNSENCF